MHCIGADCPHQQGCHLVWLWWGSSRIHNGRRVLSLGCSPSFCPGVDSGWGLGSGFGDLRYHRWVACSLLACLLCCIFLATSLSIVTLSCSCLLHGNCGGGSRSRGWCLGGGTPAACGALVGSHAKLTQRCLICAPGGAAHGKSMPVGFDVRRVQASEHIKFPLPLRKTRAGMVVSSNFANRALSCGPATASCGMAVQYGILSKYCLVSSAEAHLETKTMVALLRRCSSAMRDCRTGP